MFRSIVVGTNGSESAALAARHGAYLARLSAAPLYLARAYRLGADDEGEQLEHVEAALHRDVFNLARDGLEVEGYARVGHAADVIIDIARWKEAELIVVGNRGMRGVHRFLGSVPNAVSHHAPCTVLIVRTDSVGAAHLK